MKIGTREVGPGSPTFIIAEAGVNYRGQEDIDGALGMIDLAAKAGADAVKSQYFRVDRFLVARSYAESIRNLEMPDEWLGLLSERAHERGIEFPCTAFDSDSFLTVAPWVDAFKVGSYEAADANYLSLAVRTGRMGKPVIASSGLGLPLRPRPDFVLRCVSQYPARIEGYLREPFGTGWVGWGVSDHTTDPITVPAAAVALGACIVEKHFVDERGKGSIDDRVSLNPEEFASMVRAIRATERAVRG